METDESVHNPTVIYLMSVEDTDLYPPATAVKFLIYNLSHHLIEAEEFLLMLVKIV